MATKSNSITLYKYLKSRVLLITMSVALAMQISGCRRRAGSNPNLTATPASTESIQTQQPLILWQGQTKLQLKPGSDESVSRVDLDKPLDTISNPTEADLELQISIGSIVTYSLKPVNGASTALLDTVIDFNNCLNQKSKLSPGAIPELVEGNRICVLTSEGRLAGVQITQVKIERSGAASIDLNVVVWDKVVKN